MLPARRRNSFILIFLVKIKKYDEYLKRMVPNYPSANIAQLLCGHLSEFSRFSVVQQQSLFGGRRCKQAQRD